MKSVALLAGFLLLVPMAQGAIDAYPFTDEAMESRYKALIEELRCPQCLNTNLAGSDAMIAQDLRREVHRMLLAGNSDAEILDFMHQRYGDFILYEPRVTSRTWLLWYGPLILLLAAGAVAALVVRRGAARANDIPDVDKDRLRRLLKD